MRAMNPLEDEGIESLFESVERHVQQVPSRTDVRDHIVAVGLEPSDTLDGHRCQCRPHADEEPGHRPLSERLAEPVKR